MTPGGGFVSAGSPGVGAGSVIGTANFNGNGSISNAHYGGVISSVTFIATGTYQVNLSSLQSDFSVSVIASDDSVTGTVCCLNGTPDFHAGVTSFRFIALNTNAAPLVLRSSASITVALMKF